MVVIISSLPVVAMAMTSVIFHQELDNQNESNLIIDVSIINPLCYFIY
jgi:hypothetical protein